MGLNAGAVHVGTQRPKAAAAAAAAVLNGIGTLVHKATSQQLLVRAYWVRSRVTMTVSPVSGGGGGGAACAALTVVQRCCILLLRWC